jgi:two-component system, OmpR family, response regulator
MIPDVLNTTILLLASDPAVREVVREALESAGYSVIPTGNIGTAVDRLKNSTPDLLLVRDYIEEMSGYDAAIYLRKMCHGVPVLIFGGMLDDDRLENREILHGFEVFPVPFAAAELLKKVHEVLVKRQGQGSPGAPA